MFILRGEVESEACLVEVECGAGNLRSGAAFVYVDSNEVTTGHKCSSSGHTWYKLVTNTGLLVNVSVFCDIWQHLVTAA